MKDLLSLNKLRLNKLNFTEEGRLVSSQRVLFLALRLYCPRLIWQSDGAPPPRFWTVVSNVTLLVPLVNVVGSLQGLFSRRSECFVKGGCRIFFHVIGGRETCLLGDCGEAGLKAHGNALVLS